MSGFLALVLDLLTWAAAGCVVWLAYLGVGHLLERHPRAAAVVDRALSPTSDLGALRQAVAAVLTVPVPVGVLWLLSHVGLHWSADLILAAASYLAVLSGVEAVARRWPRRDDEDVAAGWTRDELDALGRVVPSPAFRDLNAELDRDGGV